MLNTHEALTSPLRLKASGINREMKEAAEGWDQGGRMGKRLTFGRTQVKVDAYSRSEASAKGHWNGP